ncbi:MAG TPA: phenylalanine--tRNA ligase subunit beta [Candidatus Acidoferrum sp.]|nr:phenylalanine--tRNA ligase subunit beta [Candidatus Acidoferrum sp.]
MPTIDIEYQELERLLSLKLEGDMAKLDDILAIIKGEVKLYNEREGTVSIEMKDTNRPDLWSVEGLSRALRGYLNQEKGLKQYSSGKSIVEVNVKEHLHDIRPFICCSVIKDIHLTDNTIKGIMHLQDKLDKTLGRNRQKTSIGIYNFDLIEPPIEYTAVKPNDVSFVPLGFTEKMDLDEILEKHPKGIEYGHIVKKNNFYPMLFDSEGKVLSFPPIINSNDLGKITEESRNLLIEVTGTLHKIVLNTLNLVTAALIDHGGKTYSATINYPVGSTYEQQTVLTPDFSSRCMMLSVEDTNKLLGLKLSAHKISELLLTAGLGIEKIKTDSLDVLIPCYRIDVMHQVDLIEDVAIAYGYNNIVPFWRELATTGRAKLDQGLINIARDLMVGLGYQEILTYTLTNPENLFDKMNTQRTPLVELSNPKVVTMTCLRNWILPSLMEFLSNNQSVEFPQRIYELGKVILPDETKETKTRDEEWLSAATVHANSNFTEIKSALDAFMSNFGMDWQIKETTHPSFIEGRVGKIIVAGSEVGVVGEINPSVLEAWKLENPTAAFEINLQRILESKLDKKA